MDSWTAVPGWRGYQINEAAQVRSLDRIVAAKYTLAGRRSSRFIKGKVLTPTLRPDGTPCVNLWRANRCVQVPVRRLMLLTFVGVRPRGMDAKNLDGDVTNNALSNLAWMPIIDASRRKLLLRMS
jgi:hypothetical protein